MEATAHTEGPTGGRRGLQPLGVGETLDVAIKLYRGNAVATWKTVAAVLVPIFVLEGLVRRLTLPSDVFVHNGQLYTFSGQTNAGGTVALVLVAVLALIGQLLATGAVFKLLLDAYLDHPPDWRRSLSFTRHRLGSLVALAIFLGVLLFIGFLLLFIPGLWLLVAASMSVPVLMLEGVGGWKAMQRSIQLVDTRWWATFARLITAFLLYFVLLFAIGLVAGAISRGISVTNVTLFVAIGTVLNALVAIFASPFIASVLTVAYIDLRVRREALDIELLASAYTTPGSTVPVQVSPSTAPQPVAPPPTTPGAAPDPPAPPATPPDPPS